MTTPSAGSADTPLIEVLPDAGSLATAVAGELLSRLADAQAAGHVPHIALTGGTIAARVHEEVARLSPASGVDWGTVEVWWGDERFVAADDSERNAGAARASFLDSVGATRVHEMPALGDADDVHAAAAAYSAEMREHGAEEFEIVMLGIGPDAHVASLFPGSATLAVDDRIAVGVTGSPKPPPERISLTFAALNRTRSLWVLASGDSKAEAVAAALAPEGAVDLTPARGVHGRGDTTFFLDRDAAARI